MIGSMSLNWINFIKEDIKSIDVTNKKLKQFGFLFAIIFIVLSFLVNSELNRLIFGILGLITFISAFSKPKILLQFYKIWMSFAVILGYFTSRIILTVLFYFIITPIKIIAKIFGKKFLDLKIDKQAGSYWDKVEKERISKERSEKQF